MAETEDPPPYDPEADKANAEDGPTATATEQESKPKKEKVPDEPPPDGEGELGPPLMRVYFIGGSLAFWGILAFWLMAYWLASAADPCRYSVRTYSCVIADSDNCIDEGYSACEAAYEQTDGYGGSTSSSSTGSTPSPTLPTIGRRRLLQSFNYNYYDYDNLDTLLDNYYGNNGGSYYGSDPSFAAAASVDRSSVSNGREYYNEVYAVQYGANEYGVRLTAWLLLTLGIGIGFFGAIVSYFAVKKGNACITKIAYILVGIGGALTVLGAIMFVASWNYEDLPDSTKDLWNAVKATQFLEFLFVGVMGIIFAVDLQQLLLNPEEMRLMCMTAPLAIVSLFLGGLYAYIINWEQDVACYFGVNQLLYDQMGCISAGYFLMAIGCVVRILIAKETINLGDNPVKTTLYTFILSIFIVIGGFICAVGYWATIDKIFDSDNECYVCQGQSNCANAHHYVGILTYLYGDSVQPGLITQYDVRYESQFKAFYCGYSFFIFGLTVAIAYDMDIIGNYKKVRAAQAAASATSA